MCNWSSRFATALALSVAVVANASGALLINEFQYDDASTDDREYVELYKSGPNPVDISGYSVGTRDTAVGSGASAPVVIPGALGSSTTVIPAGGYYVIGNTGVANVNQVVATGMLENDTETIELRSGPFASAALIDAVVYEGSAPLAGLPADVLAQRGANPYWGNHTGTDVAGTPLKPLTSVSRYLDGIDSDNNGRDFGMRPATPGAANSTSIITSYTPQVVNALAEGAAVSGLTGSFVGARAFTPGLVTPGLNPNAIPAAPGGGKAIIAWDNSGGGNAVVANGLFSGAQEFKLYAYFDTNNLPLSINNATPQVTFRGSEATYYGLGGSIDAFTNLANVSGLTGGPNPTTNGATGVAWYYEKVGETVTGNGLVSEKVYLIDAGAGGNSSGWTVLATIDLSAAPSAWHHLSIAIDAAGNGVAGFDAQTFNFVTAPNLNGSFYVGYRENTQDGATTVPTYLRPATFAVPEPSTIALAIVACCGLVVRRKSNA